MAATNKTKKLPKYCYARGNKIWVGLQNEVGTWIYKPTPYTLDQVDQARRYVDTLVRGFAARRGDLDPGKLTFRRHATRWVDDREKRGVGTATSERSRLEKYIYPILGDIELPDVRPRHVRDLVRALCARSGEDALAPRTIHHIYNIVHNAFESAVVDEYIMSSPVKLNPGELPQKSDDDPEWRINATYTVAEIQMLLSDPRIPTERRVLYALKALAGLRHGEAAALCWRHYDESQTPLAKLNIVQAWDSPNKVVKDTKQGEVRAVPVHRELARVLNTWRDQHWARVYGRDPGPDDFVAPTRTMRCVAGKDAVEALERDLVVLGLRTKAGKERNRGGHDMRAWFETQLIEDDADSTLSRRFTHAPPKNVAGGYERFSWKTLCRTMSKLQVKLPADPLKSTTASLQAEAKARGRWEKIVTPKGLEADFRALTSEGISHISVENTSVARAGTKMTLDNDVGSHYSGLKAARRALRRGDGDLALALMNRLLLRATS